jgi:phosphoribosylanthranilate isomerase
MVGEEVFLPMSMSMEANYKPRVKICCIKTVKEARTAVLHGASAVGFVSKMPSGPGVIPETRIAQIVKTLPPAVSSFLLTCRKTVGQIVAQHRQCQTTTIQLCHPLKEETLRQLKKALPGIKLVQVIHVTGAEVVPQARTAAPWVDALLLDSGTPTGATQTLGGTGKTHNWQISRRVREQVPVPVFLAGGLRPENVAEAIRTVRPYGVDVCTGVRKDSKLDEERLAAFMVQVQEVQEAG